MFIDNMAASSSFIKGPTLDWSSDDSLYNRFKLWKQQHTLLFARPMSEIIEENQCKYLLCWAGECAIEQFNSWGLKTDQEKSLHNYWSRFENFVKQSV